jgi:hypothetical protein
VFRRAAALVIGLGLSGPVLLGGPASAAVAPKPYDFNGDGYADLAVATSGGGLVVLPGSRSGLSLKEQLIDKFDLPVQSDVSQPALASGDFDGDGFADLAVGYGSATVDGREGAGAVRVLYGSSQGLSANGSSILYSPGSEAFGDALAAGDFDGDGITDLAAGAPLYELDPTSGYVSVFSGTHDGLRFTPSTTLYPEDLPGDPTDFGTALAAGDLDQDGRTDLVVGSAGGDDGGSIEACYGAASGLSSCTVLDADHAYDGVSSVRLGNVSGTSRPEIVLGVPDERDRAGGYGHVEIVSLSGPRGATTVSHVSLTQASKGVPGANEKDDHFGSAVALGDLDRDGFDDLVIGASGEDVGSRRDAGAATLVYGGRDGYRHSGAKSYTQNTKGIPGQAERRDELGASIALLDHDADGHLDLTLGAPGENTFQGAVTTLHGASRSFTTKGSRTFGLATLGHTEYGAEFGVALGD